MEEDCGNKYISYGSYRPTTMIGPTSRSGRESRAILRFAGP